MARKAAEKKNQEETDAVELTKEMDKLESKVGSVIFQFCDTFPYILTDWVFEIAISIESLRFRI